MHIGLHVKCRVFLSHFNETALFQQLFKKYSDIKFHKNPSCRSRIVPCSRTDGQTDGHDEDNFVNVHKNGTKFNQGDEPHFVEFEEQS
jgi:hypothetical protein